MVNLFDIFCQNHYTIHWFAIENCMREFILFAVHNHVPDIFNFMFAYANQRKEAEHERKENKQKAERTESVGEGEETYSRHDTKVLSRQPRNERRTLRRMYGAHGIRAVPP